MSDSYLDHIPSREREKIRRRLRSPEEYERLREKVKGPEDLEREMERNAEFAELKLQLETDPSAQQHAREMVRIAAKEQGIASVLERGESRLPEHFDVASKEVHGEQRLVIAERQPDHAAAEAPSGNVAEVLALKPQLQQQILAYFRVQKRE